MSDARMNVLLIDNFDSFTFNLVDELARRGARVEVWRNDISIGRAVELALSLTPPRLVVLSPGPGGPREAGCCMGLIDRLAGAIPLFGVCLGHQAIVEAFGGVVAPAGEVVHGKPSRIEHDGTGIFSGLPSPFVAGRYHSLAAAVVPEALEITARCRDVVMAVSHRDRPVVGVQFHPESILTPRGGVLVDNVLRWASSQQRETTAQAAGAARAARDSHA